MNNSKLIIFRDNNLTIWTYGHKCLKIASEIHYNKILFVYEVHNLIYFLTEIDTRSYDKTLQRSYIVDSPIVDLRVHKDYIYEVYNDNRQESIRLDVFDMTIEKYIEVDAKRPRRPIEQIIQDYVGHQIDRGDILLPKIIYSHLWPNYIIDRNAYCDITFCAEN